ncbi:MAG: VanZ family protein [Candidatus Acidiferrales bacterium]
MRWLARFWPAILWAAVIFTFSTHFFTGENTSRVITPLIRWLFPHATPHFLDRANHIVRKGAHVFEYFVFSLLLLHAIRNRRSWKLEWALAVVVIVFAFACSDEFHQIFVPGRGASFHDVMLDTFAGILAQMIVWAWLMIGHRGTQFPVKSERN